MEQNIENTQSIAQRMSRQKKVAAINDLTGYGRCALTVSLPVISHMKLQCCPVPTSILSNHTGYPEYYFDDYISGSKKDLPIKYFKQMLKRRNG